LENQTRLDTLLLTGLRFVEAQRLQENPDWFDRRFIHLPEWAQRKAKRKQRERWVKLSDKGKTVLPFFFKTRPLPDWGVWTGNLQRWAGRAHLDPRSLSVKTTRKTWESWLLAQHPERAMEIVLSMGHDEVTSVRHYAGRDAGMDERLGGSAMRMLSSGDQNNGQSLQMDRRMGK